MKNKTNLLFAFLYFICIFVGYISVVFKPLFSNIYYGHLVGIFTDITKILIYLVLAIILGVIYKKYFNKEEDRKDNLTLKKQVVLYITTLSFITIISLMAGWQLKPLSDLGEKYTQIEIYEKLASLGVLAFEIYFMMRMFKHFDNCFVSNFKDNKYFSFSIFFILVTYSIYNVLTNFNMYQLIFVPFTLLLGFIYPYTQKRFWTTYLIAVLVFLF